MNALDIVKLVIAGALLAAGIAGYYLLSEQALILRVLAVIAGTVAGAAVAWFTAPGKTFAAFARESIVEVKKVVWPSRKETVQTTAAVFAFVVVMAVYLWASDKTATGYLFFSPTGLPDVPTLDH